MNECLICGSCGAPLPRPRANAYLTCTFCGTTTQLEGHSSQPSTAQQPSTRPPIRELTAVAVKDRFASELDVLRQVFADEVEGGTATETALRAATEASFSAVCDPDVMAFVVLGIATRFDREHGTEVASDTDAIPRLAVAYLDAVEQLAKHPEHEINIPFLTATESGPLHFLQSVTVEDLQKLAHEPVAAAPEEPEPEPEPEQEEPVKVEKKPWWKIF